MQRPADELLDSENLVKQFVDQNITAIFNLTEPGEHPYCGFGLKTSGFPYTPERFMISGGKCMLKALAVGIVSLKRYY